jgi:hypothetical protein
MALDEGTAVVVQGDRVRVLGQGRALFHDHAFTPNDEGRRYLELAGGEEFDLQTRRKIAP